MKKLQIINGPNLNLLGTRQPEIYGNTAFDEYLNEIISTYKTHCTIDYFQSNVEGEIINQLQIVGFTYDGIILNAGAYTHTSIAIADAIAAISTPCIEVHISNVFAREQYRQQSYITSRCVGLISGLGLQSYTLAIQYFLKLHTTV